VGQSPIEARDYAPSRSKIDQGCQGREKNLEQPNLR